MHTEKQAGRIICHRRIDANRPIQDQQCVGSMCMAWRFAEILVDGPDSYQSEPGPKGYCGLAGLPLELQ